MTRIRNYQELIEEKARLQGRLVEQKNDIRREFNLLKENLKPLFKIFSFVGSFNNGNATQSILKLGAQTGANLLTRNTILSKAGWVAKMALPVLASGLSGALFDKVKKLFSKRKSVEA